MRLFSLNGDLVLACSPKPVLLFCSLPPTIETDQGFRPHQCSIWVAHCGACIPFECSPSCPLRCISPLLDCLASPTCNADLEFVAVIQFDPHTLATPTHQGISHFKHGFSSLPTQLLFGISDIRCHSSSAQATKRQVCDFTVS
jgi:hypothetical protein